LRSVAAFFLGTAFFAAVNVFAALIILVLGLIAKWAIPSADDLVSVWIGVSLMGLAGSVALAVRLAR
jgi:hypothetical protein